MPQNSPSPRQPQAKPFLNEDGTTFGELDTDKKHPYPATWQGMVVVTQYNVINGSNGYIAPDEGTRRLMPYAPAVFTKLVADKGFEDVQYTILHDPR